ncbi:DEAD/DEAH box helicase [Microbulbifer thermotolerans]|uniref:ATP-dependent RNA helicase DeaD n=1 Tax=Microbulbifer thermotolerans TaxID=252514 RepID=A0A143HN45_MICTH|nr:DEAD/DEAH box helicase [Microbulbifer thermotolerans]AMX03128.1 RNA helicase [Microbulbifer thermotolerans]MCX2831514.1 DEAD/DEAH box helicase [Microbulbifer thermotolerans]
MTDTPNAPSFDQLGLPTQILSALEKLGYESPSPIQAQTIPSLLEGRDVLGQAQTGTGKTAAFALPLLAQLDLSERRVQALVLAPTRELAIQVAEACQSYAANLKGFHVAPIYGGADYRGQMQQLKRGVQLVVGTPGRVMDHMRRGSLDLSGLKTLVLDEADEMLRMGFIDDVQWVLEQIPEERQVALFSATMPKEIARIAREHLREPVEVKIRVKTETAETIRQRYWPVGGLHKLDALTRILEAEPVDGTIIFVRTKNSTVELADKLTARGFAVAALNGDMAQNLREAVIDKLKKGVLDIVVATDVAARGLDVARISHVINYDIPYDAEAYIHRIGRTGRAGREGDAILFVAPRERRMLRIIEKATKKPIERLELPSAAAVNNARMERFRGRITETLEGQTDLAPYRQLVEEYLAHNERDPLDVAAALAAMVQGDQPLLIKEEERKPRKKRERGDDNFESRKMARRADSKDRFNKGEYEKDKKMPPPDEGLERFRIEVGREHGVRPGNIVGAIANEVDLDSSYIGRIEIYSEYTTVDLPEGMPKEVFLHLKQVRVAGRPMKISRLGERSGRSKAKPRGGRRAKRQ